MNSSALAYQGYNEVARATLNPRDIEYYVFARVTGNMEAAAKCASFEDQKALIAALYENDCLWLQIYADVSSSENALPLALRQQLAGLARFVTKHSANALQDAAALDDLISINKTIMKGLQGTITGE